MVPLLLLAQAAAGTQMSHGAIERKLLFAKKHGNWRQALGLLEQLHATDPTPSTTAHNNAAGACARAGEWMRALELLDELRQRGGAWDSHSYTAAVTAYGKTGRWKMSLAALGEMELASESNRDMTPSVFVYGATIGACAKSGRWREALQLLDEMAANDTPPNTRCYNGVLAACDKALQPEVALALLETMRRSDDPSCRPTVVSYATVIAAIGRRPSPSSSERTRRLLDAMADDGIEPNAFVYGNAALAYGASGAWEAYKTQYLRCC